MLNSMPCQLPLSSTIAYVKFNAILDFTYAIIEGRSIGKDFGTFGYFLEPKCHIFGFLVRLGYTLSKKMIVQAL